jgi:hypothetical protein
MIGGIDIAIPTQAGDSSLVAAVRAILQYWPDAVFENGLTAERYDRLLQVPFGRLEELFVYRDATIADAWDAEGAVPELYDTMVHLLTDDDRITVVVDSTEGAMADLIAAIRSGLSDDILHVLAEAA